MKPTFCAHSFVFSTVIVAHTIANEENFIKWLFLILFTKLSLIVPPFWILACEKFLQAKKL